MRALTTIGCLVFLSVSGCGSMKGSSTNSAPASAPAEVAADVPADTAPHSPSAATQNQPVSSDAPIPSPGTAGPAVPPPASSPIAPRPAKPTSAGDTRPVKQPTLAAKPAAPATPAPAAVAPAAAPSAAAPATATLDLGQLESRLRDTRAIGVFTKLTLKNQVDDLLSEFRDYYRTSNQRPSTELRQHYDSLLVKVLGLLRDGDPTLATAISSSREAIWGILADPDKFAKLQM